MPDDLHPKLTEERRVAAEDARQKTENLYRSVFASSPEGVEVLTDILLNLCHYFSMIGPEDKGKIAQRNVGLAILERLCLSGLDAKEFIERILSVPSIKGETT